MPTVKTVKRPTLTGHEMLSRYVANKPRYLKNKINKAMNAGGVAWRHSEKPNVDSSDICTWDELSFLGNGKAKTAWQKLWQGSDTPRFTWDAIGRVQMGKVGWNWLLVSAMTHPDELAVSPANRQHQLSPAMTTYLSNAKRKFKVGDDVIWPASSKNVQQLAVLAFLREHSVCVELLQIQFYTSMTDDSVFPTIEQWEQASAITTDNLGLTNHSPLVRRMHKLMINCDQFLGSR